ncbi:MAG TPA: prepilin-type N-terminal cleavage/methylation domain-containing protein [Atopostipes sp.]|nr:prepilin-type N-terminal cleavage/methylation domain-containing protein [Atopostipes sp.]
MRKKIEELRNREEGFTLVELLAVIVILGIIVAIAIPAIGTVIQKAGDNADDAEVEMIVDAARLYFTIEEPTEDTVTAEKLETEGYLEKRAGVTTPAVTVKRTKDAASGKVTYAAEE